MILTLYKTTQNKNNPRSWFLFSSSIWVEKKYFLALIQLYSGHLNIFSEQIICPSLGPPPKADPQSRIWVQVLNVGGGPVAPTLMGVWACRAGQRSGPVQGVLMIRVLCWEHGAQSWGRPMGEGIDHVLESPHLGEEEQWYLPADSMGWSLLLEQ